jgi:hypothetical protein
MTLGEFFNILSNNPAIVLFYFLAVPLTALLAFVFGRNEGHLSPWKYLYSILIYLTAVPGIFAITLCIYKFMFERRGIDQINIYTEILPILSMVLTLWLIKKNVSLDDIPGFDKLSGLMLVISVVLVIMWILDKTHVFAFTSIPFIYVILLLIGLFILIRFGLKKVLR